MTGKSRYKELVIDDTVYTLTPAYRAGAQAYKAGTPYNVGNPYRDGSQAWYDWNDGHVNESEGYHS